MKTKHIIIIIVAVIVGMIILVSPLAFFIVYGIAYRTYDGKANEYILEDFRSLGDDESVYMINDTYYVYTKNQTLKAADILPESTEALSISIYDGMLYISAVKKNANFDFSFYIYRFDFNGENPMELYSEDTAYHPWAVNGVDELYFYYKEDSLYVLKKFDFTTGAVTEIERSKNNNADRYASTYRGVMYDSDDKNFYIEDENGTAYSITEDVLKVSGDGQALLKYDYHTLKYSIVDGRILLAYYIPNAFWVGDKNVVVYEYDPDMNSVNYCMIAVTSADRYLTISAF